MAGSRRLPAAISRVAAYSKPAPYVCRRCRQHLHKAPKLNPQQTRHASTEWTEKLRRKIWGTDNPPGLADPYGPSWADRRRMQQQQAEEEERRSRMTPEERIAEDALEAQSRDALDPQSRDALEPQSTDALEPQSRDALDRPNIIDRDFDEPFEDDPIAHQDIHQEYKPAQTWDGLEHIGHKGHWKDVAPTLEDEYHP